MPTVPNCDGVDDDSMCSSFVAKQCDNPIYGDQLQLTCVALCGKCPSATASGSGDGSDDGKQSSGNGGPTREDLNAFGDSTADDNVGDCSDRRMPNDDPWHDPDGSEYSCAWYALKDHCTDYGADPSFGNASANIACCVCGGGDTAVDPVDKRPFFGSGTAPITSTMTTTRIPTTARLDFDPSFTCVNDCGHSIYHEEPESRTKSVACFCDALCFIKGDCCNDVYDVCTFDGSGSSGSISGSTSGSVATEYSSGQTPITTTNTAVPVDAATETTAFASTTVTVTSATITPPVVTTTVSEPSSSRTTPTATTPTTQSQAFTTTTEIEDAETNAPRPVISEDFLCAGSRDHDYCKDLSAYCATSAKARMLCPVTCNSCPTELKPTKTTSTTIVADVNHNDDNDYDNGDDGDEATCLCYQNGSAHQENDLWYSHCGLCFCLNCQPVCTHLCNEERNDAELPARPSAGSCKHNDEIHSDLDVWNVSTCEMCYCDKGTTVCSKICDDGQ